MKLAIRVDASIRIGIGHVTRCLAFANALKKTFLNLDITFLCRNALGNMNAHIRAQGYRVCELDINEVDLAFTGRELPVNCQQNEADICIKQLESNKYHLLIVDHYGLSESFCRKMRLKCEQIMVIDDLANRKHDCDLLLDQNLLPEFSNRYQDLVNKETLLLLGPKYALLRDEFYLEYHPILFEKVPNILIFFGGSDSANVTRTALLGLTRVLKPEFKAQDFNIDVVLGASNPWKESLFAEFADCQNLKWHVHCDYIAKLMVNATLSLGAGGSSHWERCITGVPSVVITVADNQIATTQYLASLGACLFLGDVKDVTSEEIALAVNRLLELLELRQQLSNNARHIIKPNDGLPRVLDVLKTHLATTGMGES